MKKMFVFAIVYLLLCNFAFSQSAKEQVYKLAESKDYINAVNYIPEAVSENRKDFDLMLLAGDIYFELDRLDSALLMYKNAVKINRDEPKALRKLARALSALGRIEEAIEKAREAIDEDRKDVYNYLSLGHVYLDADSLKQAEIQITKAREINKNIPDAFIALGDLYFAQRVYELAKNNYEKALSIDEGNVEARTKLAISYYWLANREYDDELANELFKKSLQEWNTITKQDSMNARAYFEQGKILFFAQKFDKAAQSLYEYVQLRPGGSLGRWYLAQSLYELALCDSAEPHLRICSEEIDSVKNKAMLFLARCYFDAGEYERSMTTYEQLINLDTLDLTDLERYGASAFQNGDTLKAISLYKQIIDKDSSRCKLIFKTGAMLYILENFEESIEMMSKRIGKCEDEYISKTYFYLGQSFLKLGSLKESAEFFLKAYEADSTDYLSLVYLSDVYAKAEIDDSALYYLDIVISKSMADTAKYGWLANNAYAKICNLYYKGKDYLKLKNSALDWIKLKKETPIAYLYIATYYQSVKDLESACRYYRQVIRYDNNGKLKDIARDIIQKLNCP
jgi:tetratricopeptide (TPR) repeat protein